MIYKKIVKVICLSFALILMIGVCGCMESRYPSFTKDELSEYLRKKYGTEFTFLEPMDDRQPETYSYSAYFTCAELSNKRILAKVYVVDESNEKLYADNYYAILYEDESREILEKIANSVYPDSKCIYEIDDTTVSPNSGMNTISIDDYLMSSTSGLYLTIILPAKHDLQNKENEANLLAKSLIEHKIVCTCKVIYTVSEEDFNSFDSDSSTNFADNRATGYIYINDDLEVRKIEWR